jgi:hypothetical protein
MLQHNNFHTQVIYVCQAKWTLPAKYAVVYSTQHVDLYERSYPTSLGFPLRTKCRNFGLSKRNWIIKRKQMPLGTHLLRFIWEKYYRTNLLWLMLKVQQDSRAQTWVKDNDLILIHIFHSLQYIHNNYLMIFFNIMYIFIPSDNHGFNMILLIDWCLTPTFAIFQLYRGIGFNNISVFNQCFH